MPALNRVAENPLQYQVLHREARRAIVHRFPYGVFYRIEASNIVVFLCEPLAPRPGMVESSRSLVGANKRMDRSGLNVVATRERRWAGGSRARRSPS